MTNSEKTQLPSNALANRLRADADTLEGIGYEPFAKDLREAAFALDVPSQLLDVHSICDQRDHYRAALQKIRAKQYHCCGADRVAAEALGSEPTGNETKAGASLPDPYSWCSGQPHNCPYIYCHSQLKCAKEPAQKALACVHDLRKPDTTMVVLSPRDAQCSVCQKELHIPPEIRL